MLHILLPPVEDSAQQGAPGTPSSAFSFGFIVPQWWAQEPASRAGSVLSFLLEVPHTAVLESPGGSIFWAAASFIVFPLSGNRVRNEELRVTWGPQTWTTEEFFPTYSQSATLGPPWLRTAIFGGGLWNSHFLSTFSKMLYDYLNCVSFPPTTSLGLHLRQGVSSPH